MTNNTTIIFFIKLTAFCGCPTEGVVILSAGEGRIPRREGLMKGLKVKSKFLGRRAGRPQHTQRGEQKTCVEETTCMYIAWLVYRSGRGKLWPLGQILPAAFVCMPFTYPNVHLSRVYTSVVFSLFIELCDHYQNLILEHFQHPERKLCTHWQSLPISHAPTSCPRQPLIYVLCL